MNGLCYDNFIVIVPSPNNWRHVLTNLELMFFVPKDLVSIKNP